MPEFPGSTKFFFSEADSEPSTRGSSPAPGFRLTQIDDPYKQSPEGLLENSVDNTNPGLLPDHVYDSGLVWWRARVRRMLMKSLKTESHRLAMFQACVRTSWLDAYFVYSSYLGTHTFFLLLLPGLFFLGHDKTALGLLTVLGMGGYWCSVLKDLFCTSRPFSPPVTRLTIGSHHLEYGFPSTHSTNSASGAVYIHTLIYRLYLSGIIPSISLYIMQAILAWYILSIVIGRLYCGMHSLTDCAVGVALGSAVSLTYLVFEEHLEQWLSRSGWSVPLTLTFLVISMINQHPQPVDDCPCFEDAIAFISSIMGVMLGKWHAIYFGLKQSGKSFLISAPGNDWNAWTMRLTFAGLRLFFGILSIFVWRLVAKAVLHAVLPPIFRFAAHIFTLPNRRFYTPATEYESVPTQKGLHPIPSVIDLTHSPTMMAEASATLPRVGGEGLKLRNGGLAGSKTADRYASRDNGSAGTVIENPTFAGHSEHRKGGPKHYDADVLTKFVVYTGIGMISSEWGPLLFEYLGWGVIS